MRVRVDLAVRQGVEHVLQRRRLLLLRALRHVRLEAHVERSGQHRRAVRPKRLSIEGHGPIGRTREACHLLGLVELREGATVALARAHGQARDLHLPAIACALVHRGGRLSRGEAGWGESSEFMQEVNKGGPFPVRHAPRATLSGVAKEACTGPSRAGAAAGAGGAPREHEINTAALLILELLGRPCAAPCALPS